MVNSVWMTGLMKDCEIGRMGDGLANDYENGGWVTSLQRRVIN